MGQGRDLRGASHLTGMSLCAQSSCSQSSPRAAGRPGWDPGGLGVLSGCIYLLYLLRRQRGTGERSPR